MIPKFITAVLAGQQPRIFGDGTQSRDFCHIDNVIEANLAAASAPAAAASGGVFNIGCGHAIDLNQVVALIGDIVADGTISGSRPNTSPSGPATSSTRGPTSAQRANNLGYRGAVSFAEGLRRTIDWYKSQG